MLRGDLFLHELAEFFGLGQQLVRFGFRRRVRSIIINKVPLAPTSVEVRDPFRDWRSHRDFDGLKARQMMSWAGDAIAGTGNHDFRQLQNGIIGRRKFPVRRERGDGGVL